MASTADASNFNASLGCLIASDMEELAAQLHAITGLNARECDVVLAATRESLEATLHGKLSRLLVLELNAARVMGQLGSGNGQGGWARFLEISARREFWDALAMHYPTLLQRVDRIVRNRCAASLLFARRWVCDRSRLAPLCGGDAGELEALSFGAGDSHRKGLTVAMVRCESGPLVYKPRSVEIDAALRRFVRDVSEQHNEPLSIDVPSVVVGDGYGWAQFVAHRYAADESELHGFYRGIGQWLAIMRLLGGSDLHAENLIARGGSPVVIDCETLFTPRIAPKPSGLGSGPDLAAELIAGTVLNIGLLPGRGAGLGWRGVDSSAVGMLPGQQPMMTAPGLIEAGSDKAHIGTHLVEAPCSQNHPSAEPALFRYWPEVLRGFDTLTTTLQRLDCQSVLRSRLKDFANCQVRVVPRATEIYAEIGRMLWHPISLHDEEQARTRASDLLARMAANVSTAPDDPEVIQAEIADLLEGDIPFFSTWASGGGLEGPRGTLWRQARPWIEDTWQAWRQVDYGLERKIIRASLVSAYVNDGWMPEDTLLPASIRTGAIDSRRRRQAAAIMEGLIENAILGNDGSVAWIAPVLGETGWSVQPLGPDLYNGSSGIALLAGAYLREASAGRADSVEGVDRLFASALYTLALAEAKRADQQRLGAKLRPQLPGGYIGLGSQIWTYLVLAGWGMDGEEGLSRARKLAEGIPEAVAADETHDLLSGAAGAIVPLLILARMANDSGYRDLASEIGLRLRSKAEFQQGQLFWRHQQWPDGVGGFAHGVSGIGWALSWLARESNDARHDRASREAFAFEEGLFDPEEGNWRDFRMLAGAKTAAAWCHGSVGIGLAFAGLDPQQKDPKARELLRVAASATWRLGVGWNHCVCHGDLGAWELLREAVRAGVGPVEVTEASLLEMLLTSLEDHGPCCGVLRETFAPGLMPGVSGIAYQLLRAHPDSDLPSILVPIGGLDRHGSR